MFYTSRKTISHGTKSNADRGNGRRGLRQAMTGLCLGIAALASIATLPGAASAASITWIIGSSFPHRINVEVYSITDDVVWTAGGGYVWGVDYGSEIELTTTCYPGEKLCYGAWERGNEDSYWGVGYDQENGCQACCMICGNGERFEVQLTQ